MSQSPSKPGHNSNQAQSGARGDVARRNPLQNRVTIQIIAKIEKQQFKSRNPLQNRVTIQINALNIGTDKNSRNPLQNRVTIQIKLTGTMEFT
ncbi:hypothetical protein MHK_001136, partial [Candidatus Magnetomorum sp. HK-1]